MNSTTAPSIKVSGLKKASATEREFKFGRMAQSTKAIGVTIWPTVEAVSFIQMAMFMKVNGLMTRHTAVAPMFIWMEHNIPENGAKISNMGSA